MVVLPSVTVQLDPFVKVQPWPKGYNNVTWYTPGGSVNDLLPVASVMPLALVSPFCFTLMFTFSNGGLVVIFNVPDAVLGTVTCVFAEETATPELSTTECWMV